jgi:hypothetical protein
MDETLKGKAMKLTATILSAVALAAVAATPASAAVTKHFHHHASHVRMVGSIANSSTVGMDQGMAKQEVKKDLRKSGD